MVWTPHATVATIVEQNGRFLMVEEICHGKLVINQPAGHIEEGESILDAARRETIEETAYSVELEHITGFYTYPAENGVTYHRFCFAARVNQHHTDYPLDDGIVRARWMTLEELESAPNLRSEMVLTCIRDFVAGKRYPMSLITEEFNASVRTPKPRELRA